MITDIGRRHKTTELNQIKVRPEEPNKTKVKIRLDKANQSQNSWTKQNQSFKNRTEENQSEWLVSQNRHQPEAFP